MLHANAAYCLLVSLTRRRTMPREMLPRGFGVAGRGSWFVVRGSWVVGRGSSVVGRGSWVVGFWS